MKNHHYGFKHKEADFQGRMHPGYDYNGPGPGHSDRGMKLVSIAPAKITFVANGHNRGWGNMLCYMVDMEQFFTGYELERPDWCPERIWIKYAHCEKIYVKEGDTIGANEHLADLGGTGGWWSHLHWDMKKVANGPMFYPSKAISEEEFDRIYLDPEKFIAAVNEYITVSKEMPAVNARLIKAKNDPKVYYYNGKRKFYIPDWYTKEELFEDEEILEITKSQLKQIDEAASFPTLHP